MKTKLLILALCLSMMAACRKESVVPYDPANPLIGKWRSDKLSFIITDFSGVTNPFAVTKKADSLFVRLLPAFDLKYKVISVNSTTLKVSDQSGPIVFTRIRSDIRL
jgi:hypothetical protein